MIPLRLELTNFLSYRQTADLDFNNIHVACISGLNGAGKSSLLDGMTWALFGKSRSSSDNDVVNTIAARDGDEANVTFDFMLDKAIYRIIRRKKADRAMKLELQIQMEDGNWRTLSETKRTETQAAIENLLRMNYSTFTNASFLLQGKADEFTTNPPGKRKEILADLLGVTQWDVYKERAAARRKTAEGQELMLDGQLKDIADELKEEEARKTAVSIAQTNQAQIHERLQDKEQLLEQVRLNKTAVDQQTKQLATTRKQLDTAHTRFTSLRKNQAQRQRERDSHAQILAESEAIAAAFADWQEAEQVAVAQQKLADQFHALDKERHAHTLTIAREKSKLEQQREALLGEETGAQTAVSQQETIARELAAATAELEAVTAALAQIEADEIAYHEARSALQGAQSARALAQQELTQLQKEGARMGRLEKEKTAVFDERDNAAAALESARAMGEQTAAFKQNLAAAEAEIQSLKAEQPRLKEEMDALKERIDRLKAQSGGSCPLCDQALSEEHRSAVLRELEADGGTRGDRFRANKARQAALTKAQKKLTAQIKAGAAAEKQHPIAQARLAKADARLAEIETALVAWAMGDSAAMVVALQVELDDKTAVMRLQTEVDRLKAAVANKAAQEKTRRQLEQKIAQAETQLRAFAAQIEKWEGEGMAALTAVNLALQNEQYSMAARADLARLNGQIDGLGYDSIAHEAAREARKALADAPARHQQLGQSQAAVKPLDDSLADLQTQVDEQAALVAALEGVEKTAVVELEKMSANSGDLRGVETAVHDLREEHIQAVRQTGAAQQKLAVLDDQRVRQTSLLADKTTLGQQIHQLKLLEKACGRNGVQALLIERALPEIEEQANDLLGRLTNDEMSIRFETQRQLKSRKGTAETLDIRLQDGKGERPYANFSGGEQFRVNFAIRLALSQLLARRAGVNLRTLVIDEGFGSQDPNGRQRLIEAINTVQETFDRILVITHVDALRDAFPTRIEVEKTDVGSRFVVI